MTPGEIAGVTAIISEIGAWPAIVVLAMFFLAPWLLMMWITRAMEKRHAEVVEMYKNNVLLVESYQRLSNELAGIIHMSTQVMTRLVDKIDNNMYCPIAKERK